MKVSKGPKLLQETVIPELVAFKSVLAIRDIQLRKADEFKKAKEKAELDGKPIPEKVEKDQLTMTEEELTALRLEQQEAGFPPSELEKEKEAARKERETYGRFWIWEGYFNEKNREQWLETAEALKHINDHVLEDIEDHILMKGFERGTKPEKIRDLVEADQKMRMINQKLREEKPEEFQEHALKQTQKRKFMDGLRPPHYWNFFEDAPEDQRVKHVLRFNADPNKAYADGRVEKILTNIMEIGLNLRNHEDVKWNQLLGFIHEIFEHDNKKNEEELDAIRAAKD